MDGEALVERYGMVLQSGRGAIPNLPELVVGEPVKGSWWAHPDHDRIFLVLNQAVASGRVVRLKLVENKITLVHRRLWPAIVRLEVHFQASQLAARHQEHTASGSHRATTTPFPEWVPGDVMRDASILNEDEAFAQMPECLRAD